MRVIGSIPHPTMKITVFQNDGRFPVQFELGGLTQVYRFRQGEGFNHFGDLRRVIDEAFQREVLLAFDTLKTIHQRVSKRHEPRIHDDHDGLPHIL